MNAKAFERLLPALQHFAKFPTCNRAGICKRHGLDLVEVESAIRSLCGSLSIWDEEALAAAAKDCGVKLPVWRPLPPPPQAEPTPLRRAIVAEPVPEKLKATPPTKALMPAAVKLVPSTDVVSWLLAQQIGNAKSHHTYEIMLTPAVASAWLKFNEANRRPSNSKIRRFAAAMKAGRWEINGETVKFSESGRLIDGQSRLMAIVQAGVPCPIEIRTGLRDLAQQSMDSGELRRGSHTLEMLGESAAAVLAPALRWLWQWERNWFVRKPFGTSCVMENGEYAPLLAKHPGMKASVGWSVSTGHKCVKLMPRTDAAFWHYMLGWAGVEKRDTFFEQLIDGVGLTKTSPVYHLRERLIERRQEKAGRADDDRVDRGGLIIKAWNLHFHGSPCTDLRFRMNGDKPETFPKIEGGGT